jgi:regulator of sigma E protease
LENREGQQPDSIKPGHPPQTGNGAGAPLPPDTRLHGGPPPYPAVEDLEEPPMTIRQWLALNGFSILVVAGVLGLIFYYFDFDGQLNILKAALGLSFVIFIHELGHFLVAKWCDVNVTTFSIGFGPAIPGCSWKWGETTYKLSLVPLGGYVQMVGQIDGDESGDGIDDDPRSYRNKSVGQRMAIISAGVIMNVILAVICFIVVYQGPGKERPAAVIGMEDTSSPGYVLGVCSGDDILQIGDTKNPTFETLMIRVMASTPDEEINFIIKHLDGQVVDLWIKPRKQETDLKPMIGVSPADRLQLAQTRNLGSDFAAPVYPGSGAAEATPSFAFGDKIVAMTDPNLPGQFTAYDPHKITDLPDDPRAPGMGQKDFFAFYQRMAQLADKEVIVRVQRGKAGHEETVEITVPPVYRYTLGARMQMGAVVSVRQGSPAAGKVHEPDPATKRQGDKILSVSVKNEKGETITYGGEKAGSLPLDPERLPHQLTQWAAALDHYESENPGKKLSREVTLELRRHRDLSGEQFETKTATLVWNNKWRYDRAVPMTPNSPLAIPELGLAYQVQTTVAAVEDPNSPLKPGDVIKNIKWDVQGNKELIERKWQREKLEDGQWAYYSLDLLQSPYVVPKVYLEVSREGKLVNLELSPQRDKTWGLAERGWLLMRDVRRQKASGIVEAVAMGFHDTKMNMIQVFQNLRGMFTGRLSAKNLVGPVKIAEVAYRFAALDGWEFIFFLGLISVNLAVVNFLPVPVLDGGHMVFLLYEKLRGKPASEGVRVAATYAGLVLILSLMIFVFWLDITRLLS